MLLRTKIFREMVLLAVVPSLLIGFFAYFLVRFAVDQTGQWLSGASPERTINSMRIAESRLQRAALDNLLQLDSSATRLNGLDWLVVGKQVYCIYTDTDSSQAIGSLLLQETDSSGFIHVNIGRTLYLGASAKTNQGVIAGGYLLDAEYLDGFHAAMVSLRETREYKNIVPGFILFLVTGGGAVLLIVLVLSYWLSHRLSVSITTPLEQLSRMAVEMGRMRDIHTPAPSTGTDEILRLTDSFTRMFAELERNRKRLIAVERVAAWQGFARRMAHELKNPLTPISLSLYRIKNKLQKSGIIDEYKDSLEAISGEVAHLERLASDFGSLAVLPEAIKVRFDLRELISEIIELHSVQLEPFDFTLYFSERPLWIIGDPDRLREVIINVLKNAIEFCVPQGKISVETTVTDMTLNITISNEVGTINAENLRDAKLPYVTTRKGGSGLGLALSEKIIIEHKGELRIEPVENVVVVTITLPVGNDMPGS